MFYKNRPVRIYKELCPTLRSERIGLLVIEVKDVSENKGDRNAQSQQ